MVRPNHQDAYLSLQRYRVFPACIPLADFHLWISDVDFESATGPCLTGWSKLDWRWPYCRAIQEPILRPRLPLVPFVYFPCKYWRLQRNQFQTNASSQPYRCLDPVDFYRVHQHCGISKLPHFCDRGCVQQSDGHSDRGAILNESQLHRRVWRHLVHQEVTLMQDVIQRNHHTTATLREFKDWRDFFRLA